MASGVLTALEIILIWDDSNWESSINSIAVVCAATAVPYVQSVCGETAGMKRNWIRWSVVLFVACIYIARVVYINRNNASFDIVFYKDNEKVEYDGMEYSIKEQKLYELSAYAEKYPEAAAECSPEGNSYVLAGMPEAYESLKYILEIRLGFTNCSKEEKEIDISGYQMNNKNQTMFQGFSLELTALRNDAILQQFAPGETKEVTLVYDMLGINSRNLTYERLKNEPLAVILSGYPNPKQLTLNHLELVKAKGDGLVQKKTKTKTPSVQKENTPAGTVMKVGGEVISNGIGTSVADLQIVKNANDYEEYHPDSWRGDFRENNLHPDGTVDTYMEITDELPDSYYKKGYENYIFFVKLRIHNYNDQKQQAYFMYELLNRKNDLTIDPLFEYKYIPRVHLKPEDSKTMVEAGGDIYITLGYARSIRNDCDVHKEPFYISNCTEYCENFDLSKGKGGYGVYLQIQ